MIVDKSCTLQCICDTACHTVHKGTRLQVKQVLRGDREGVVLQHSDGTCYLAGTDNIRNFSSLPSRKPMLLADFINYHSLPKLGTFHEFKIHEGIFYDEATCHAIHAALSGPVKFKEVVEFSCYIGWIVQQEVKAGNHQETCQPENQCVGSEENELGQTGNQEEEVKTSFHVTAFLIPEDPVSKVFAKRNKKRKIDGRFTGCNFEKLVTGKLFTKDLNPNAVTQVGQFLLKLQSLRTVTDTFYDMSAADLSESPDVPTRHACQRAAHQDNMDHDYVNFPSLSRRKLITSLTLSQTRSVPRHYHRKADIGKQCNTRKEDLHNDTRS